MLNLFPAIISTTKTRKKFFLFNYIQSNDPNSITGLKMCFIDRTLVRQVRILQNSQVQNQSQVKHFTVNPKIKTMKMMKVYKPIFLLKVSILFITNIGFFYLIFHQTNLKESRISCWKPTIISKSSVKRPMATSSSYKRRRLITSALGNELKDSNSLLPLF